MGLKFQSEQKKYLEALNEIRAICKKGNGTGNGMGNGTGNGMGNGSFLQNF